MKIQYATIDFRKIFFIKADQTFAYRAAMRCCAVPSRSTARAHILSDKSRYCDFIPYTCVREVAVRLPPVPSTNLLKKGLLQTTYS